MSLPSGKRHAPALHCGSMKPPDHRLIRTRLEGADLRAAWEHHAAELVAWARTPTGRAAGRPSDWQSLLLLSLSDPGVRGHELPFLSEAQLRVPAESARVFPLSPPLDVLRDRPDSRV